MSARQPPGATLGRVLSQAKGQQSKRWEDSRSKQTHKSHNACHHVPLVVLPAADGRVLAQVPPVVGAESALEGRDGLAHHECVEEHDDDGERLKELVAALVRLRVRKFRRRLDFTVEQRRVKKNHYEQWRQEKQWHTHRQQPAHVETWNSAVRRRELEQVEGNQRANVSEQGGASGESREK